MNKESSFPTFLEFPNPSTLHRRGILYLFRNNLPQFCPTKVDQIVFNRQTLYICSSLRHETWRTYALQAMSVREPILPGAITFYAAFFLYLGQRLRREVVRYKRVRRRHGKRFADSKQHSGEQELDEIVGQTQAHRRDIPNYQAVKDDVSAVVDVRGATHK